MFPVIYIFPGFCPEKDENNSLDRYGRFLTTSALLNQNCEPLKGTTSIRVTFSGQFVLWRVGYTVVNNFLRNRSMNRLYVGCY